MPSSSGSRAWLVNICQTLHITTGLNVHFVDASLGSFLVFKHDAIPEPLEASIQCQYAVIVAQLRERSPTEHLFFTDHFRLRYLAVGVRDGQAFLGAIVCGPFLFDIPNDEFIADVARLNRLSTDFARRLHELYKTILILDSERYTFIGHLMVNLSCHPFELAQIVPVEAEPEKPARKKQALPAAADSEAQATALDLRYQRQNVLMEAVASGDFDEAMRQYRQIRFDPSGRMPGNPLRAHKNMALAFNTMLRISAERGKVAPVFIHETSTRFALQIERIASISELEVLFAAMVKEYCELVRRLSTRGLGPVVRRCVDYINVHYASPISLADIAARTNVNPSHLSRQFKKETGLTITDFINRKRIEEATFLISQGCCSIAEIAEKVGFESQNYFATTFRRHMLMTPSMYIKNH